MEDDAMDDLMNNALAHSLEGNALGVKDVVDALLSAKALEALQSMKIDVAQSVYGSSERPDEDEVETEVEAEDDWELPETDDSFDDQEQELEDLFAELEDLTDYGDESDEESEESEETDNEE